MNHCGVLRKMTGFFERQEWGYWCFSRPRAINAPAPVRAAIAALLAPPFLPLSVMTYSPVKPGASSVNAPSGPTVKGIAVSIPLTLSAASLPVQASKSSRP